MYPKNFIRATFKKIYLSALFYGHATFAADEIFTLSELLLS